MKVILETVRLILLKYLNMLIDTNCPSDNNRSNDFIDKLWKDYSPFITDHSNTQTPPKNIASVTAMFFLCYMLTSNNVAAEGILQHYLNSEAVNPL